MHEIHIKGKVPRNKNGNNIVAEREEKNLYKTEKEGLNKGKRKQGRGKVQQC